MHEKVLFIYLLNFSFYVFQVWCKRQETNQAERRCSDDRMLVTARIHCVTVILKWCIPLPNVNLLEQNRHTLCRWLVIRKRLQQVVKWTTQKSTLEGNVLCRWSFLPPKGAWAKTLLFHLLSIRFCWSKSDKKLCAIFKIAACLEGKHEIVMLFWPL